jgi:hypothetical protein
MPIELLVLFVSLVFWVVNQIIFRRGIISLQHFITLAMILGGVTVCFNYSVLWSDNVRDESTFLNLGQNLAGMMFEIAIYSTLILAAKGWCIVVPRVVTSDVTEIVLYCSVLFIFRELYAKIQMIVFAVCMFALTSGLMLLLWLSLIDGIKTVDKRIVAHMRIIYNAGINPYTTPIYYKHLIYSFFVHVTVIYFSGNVVVMSLELTGSLHAWVKDMLTWILNAGLLCSLGFLFRSRKVDCSGYLRFDGGEQMNFEVINTMDLEFLDSANSSTLLDWQEGMSLPPAPVVVTDPKKEQARAADGIGNGGPEELIL